MNCFNHPTKEAVATCGKCGVAMCKECEEKAFLRLDFGKGQALCNRCSLVEAEADVAAQSKSLLSTKIKLIVSAVFVIVGLLFSFIGDLQPLALVFFFFSGTVLNFGKKKENNASVKEQVSEALYEENHPFMTMIIDFIKFIVTAIFGPILLIYKFVMYLGAKKDYKASVEFLDNIRASVN